MIGDRLPDEPSPSALTRRQRLVATYAAALVGIILLYTLLYNAGMRTLEGDPHSIFRSFQTVVETMTTTGYGADSPWTTPLMNVFVVWMQLTGIVIGFVTLRILIIPLFERAPVDLSDRLTPKDDHVVICEYRRDSDVLLDELEERGIDYVLIDSETEAAKRLSDAGYQAISGDLERPETLERASIRDASTVVADAGDRNASVVLTARRLADNPRTIAVTDEPIQERALRRVGADAVLSPHALIGRNLMGKATTGVDVPGDEGTVVGDVELRELAVRRDSPLCGRRLGETELFERPDLALVAAWIDGELRLPPPRDERITGNTVVLVAGSPEAIDDAREAAAGGREPRHHTSIVIGGTGTGGRAALEALPDGVDATTIDRKDGDRVDVVGDLRDPATLETAGIADATALVLTLDDDAATLLAIAFARTLADDADVDLDIFARVTETGKTLAAFDAGADYVLSTQRVGARLLASEIRDEGVIAPVNQIRLVEVDAGPLAGRTIEVARRETGEGVTVVGVERDGTLSLDPATGIEAGETVLLAGTDAAVESFAGDRE